ncbi:receptor activity-modifying protein 2 isoform X1 [Dromiciops gliroides]|uniref:receptor activity-modifying protein 2 isoform X1 n=1 Tax=Dromiciops gliroides TaxID=33562 RepID=UPI001CC5D438|nr:receptor activity-modifying protein 2 isoform X1 [Dromiciops gliroides]
MASIGTDRSGSSHLPAIPARLRSPLWLLLLLCSTLNSKGSDAQTVPDVNNVDPSKLNVMTSEQKYELTARQCWFYYSEHMENISREDWCEWDMISRPYSDLQSCLEKLAEFFKMGFPNPWAEQIIFQSHQMYFANCSLERRPLFFDPPEEVLLALIIAPICLIPFLVTLVVWRSKDSEVQT